MADEAESAKTPKPAPARTLTQWKPPAGATQTGLTVRTQEPPVSAERERVRTDIGYAKTEATDHAPGTPVSSIPPPAPLAVGDTIADRYVVEQHISSGGFGSVYRASDKQIHNHQVAIKLLHNPAASEEARESALRELTLIASVSHPSVVQFKDYGWIDGRLWFAMPWYRGTTLDKRLEDSDGHRTHMKRTDARPIFERLAQGLAAMHDVGIHHHDIKPENVFLADIAGFANGLPVLLDLGIAAKRGETPKGLTIEYAAPETAAAALGEASGPIGAAADVFSLALVLRSALEPESMPPLDADNALAILRRRATEPVPPVESRDLRYLRPHFARWLSLDPAERPSAETLAEQFALLTEPEERRKNRIRILQRVIPVLVIAALAVTGLWYQLKQRDARLAQQTTELLAEQRESDQLRRASENQLAQLEKRSAELGSERQRFEDALKVAHDLNSQLATTERKNDTLTKRVERLDNERASLSKERDLLIGERDGLIATRERLTSERDQYRRERDVVTKERDGLAIERDLLEQRTAQLQRDRETLTASLAAERNARQDANRRLLELDRDLASLRAQYKEANRRVGELESERDRVEAIRRSLERQLSALERKKGSAAQPSSGGTGGTSTAPAPSAPAPTSPTPAWR